MAVVTPKFRVSYPSVFKPKLNTLSKQEEYSLVALFGPKDKEDFKKMEAEAEKVLIKKWGKDKNAWPKNLKNPFRDQAEREKLVDGKMKLPAGYEAGSIFVTLKSKTRPGVVDEQVQPILDETQFYAGCWAIAAVEASAYDNAGNRGVSFYVKHIQKVADGEPLGGSTKAEDHFSPIEGAGKVKSSSDLFS